MPIKQAFIESLFKVFKRKLVAMYVINYKWLLDNASHGILLLKFKYLFLRVGLKSLIVVPLGG